MSDFDVSVIIPTMNRPNDLALCIESILRQTMLPKELIIVDASETEETSELISTLSESIQGLVFYYRKSRPNLPGQRNNGLRLTHCEYICFLDDDVELDSRFFEEIYNLFKDDQLKNIGGVGGRMVNFQFDVSSLQFRIEKLIGGYRLGEVSRIGENVGISFTDSLPIKVQWLSGCACAFRREIFTSFSFEEAFTGYSLYEDADFSSRVSKKWELRVQPRAEFVHNFSPANRVATFSLGQMRVRNQYYMFKYNVLNKSIIDYLRFFLFICFRICLYSARSLKDPDKVSFKTPMGFFVGMFGLVLGRYPHRSSTVNGVL